MKLFLTGFFLVALVMGGTTCNLPEEEWTGEIDSFVFGNLVYPDLDEVATLADAYFAEFEELTGLPFPGDYEATFVTGVPCKVPSGHLIPYAIRDRDKDLCYAGLMFNCFELYVVLGENQEVSKSALGHELLHCYLQEVYGDADGDHSEPIWSEAGL